MPTWPSMPHLPIFIQSSFLYALVIQRLTHRPTALASPQSFLEMQNLSLCPHPPDQNLQAPRAFPLALKESLGDTAASQPTSLSPDGPSSVSSPTSDALSLVDSVFLPGFPDPVPSLVSSYLPDATYFVSSFSPNPQGADPSPVSSLALVSLF